MAESGKAANPGADLRHLVHVALDERTVLRRSPEVEHERRVAIFDILEQNRFCPDGHEGGPYRLHLAVVEGRLVFDIRDTADRPVTQVVLAVTPFKRIIREYFMVCESYYAAIKNAPPSRIEALDMARRGLHNDGSALLMERLQGKILTDPDTARRLFTLICVLHIRG